MQYLNGDTEGNYYYSLSSIAKGQISDTLWYTGSVPQEAVASEAYIAERNDLIIRANSKVNYTTTWIGKIGLIYLSDLGYAGINCGDYRIINYNDSNSCGYTSNWLKADSGYYWTITPKQTSLTNGKLYTNTGAWAVSHQGASGSFYVDDGKQVRPALYLDSNIQIIGGDGNTVPFKLSA